MRRAAQGRWIQTGSCALDKAGFTQDEALPVEGRRGKVEIQCLLIVTVMRLPGRSARVNRRWRVTRWGSLCGLGDFVNPLPLISPFHLTRALFTSAPNTHLRDQAEVVYEEPGAVSSLPHDGLNFFSASPPDLTV